MKKASVIVLLLSRKIQNALDVDSRSGSRRDQKKTGNIFATSYNPSDMRYLKCFRRQSQDLYHRFPELIADH